MNRVNVNKWLVESCHIMIFTNISIAYLFWIKVGELSKKDVLNLAVKSF